MAQQLRYFSQYNGFLPQLTGQVISYIRNPAKFKLNQYVQYVKTDTPIGAYYVMGRDLPARIPANQGTPSQGSTDFLAWADGASRKEMGRYNEALFKMQNFTVVRRNTSAHIGWMTRDSAQAGGLQLLSFYSAALAQQMMTVRTSIALNTLESSANWPSNHALSANTLNGGKGTWDTASDDPNSPNYNAIQLTINNAVQQIVLDTNGQVTETDMVLVISVPAAIKLRASAELTNFIRENGTAYELIYGEKAKENWNRSYGLPPYLYGVKLVIEDTSVVTQMDNATGVEATANRTFLKSSNSALLLSRPGSLDGNFGAPSYSVFQIYHYDGLMKVSAFDDAEDQTTRVHCEEAIAPVVAAGYAGMLIQNVLPA